MLRSRTLRCAVLALGLALLPTGVAQAAPLAEPAASVAVTGTVTGAGGEPVADVCVAVRPPEQGWWDRRTCTGADGTYAMDLAPGRYQVQFDEQSDALGLQWWPQVHSPAEAAWLVVRRGQPVDGVDAALVPAASMSGRAMEGATGSPMADACITITTPDGEEHVGSAQPPDHGRWTVGGLPPTDLTVRVRRCELAWRLTWAYDALTVEDATVFELASGAQTDIGRLELVAGATITGTVTARASGEPIAGISIASWTDGRSGEPGPFRDSTDGNGRYEVTDVQPGTWYPTAEDRFTWEHRPRWAIGWADGAKHPRQAEPTVLEPGETVVVDFRLDPGAVLRGRIVGTDQVPTTNAVIAWQRPGDDRLWTVIGHAGERPGDRFAIFGLPATKVTVAFLGEDVFFHDGATELEDATLLKLRPGKTKRILTHLPS